MRSRYPQLRWQPSLGYDLGRKAGLYAGFGIAELWVIDAVKLRTHIHREPGPDGYRSVADFSRDQRLEPTATPALAVTLAELDPR
jgi:Uma2 family endonuclease